MSFDCTGTWWNCLSFVIPRTLLAKLSQAAWSSLRRIAFQHNLESPVGFGLSFHAWKEKWKEKDIGQCWSGVLAQLFIFPWYKDDILHWSTDNYFHKTWCSVSLVSLTNSFFSSLTHAHLIRWGILRYLTYSLLTVLVVYDVRSLSPVNTYQFLH